MTTNQEKKLSTSDIADADREGRTSSHDPDDRLPPPGAPRAVDEAPAPLFANEDASGYRTRWSAIQTGFVDEPRKAVEEADTLVAEVMKRLAEVFADELGNSSRSGSALTRSRPRTSDSRCDVIDPSSSACWRSEYGSHGRVDTPSKGTFSFRWGAREIFHSARRPAETFRSTSPPG
jgi:hypothetical protein